MKKKITVFLLLFVFSSSQLFGMNAPAVSAPSPLPSALDKEKFRPLQIRSLILNQNERTFDLMLDRGDEKNLKTADSLEIEKELMEYFLTGISLPNDRFWVNLRPDGENDMIDPLLENTDLGKVLLEADVNLKKDMAKAISPETPEGKLYWDKLYSKAESLFGMGTKVTLPALARPWIVPGEIIINQSGSGVFIYKASLKVMLEHDFLNGSKEFSFSDNRLKELNAYSAALLKQLILPSLIKKINSSKSYASLRQVYYSLILAQWFKRHFNGTSVEYADRIDSLDLTDIGSRVAWSKKSYFDAYSRSFNQGEFALTEKITKLNGASDRTYVCGGIVLNNMVNPNTGGTEFVTINSRNPIPAQMFLPGSGLEMVTARTLQPINQDGGLLQALKKNFKPKGKEVKFKEPPFEHMKVNECHNPVLDIPGLKKIITDFPSDNLVGIIVMDDLWLGYTCYLTVLEEKEPWTVNTAVDLDKIIEKVRYLGNYFKNSVYLSDATFKTDLAVNAFSRRITPIFRSDERKDAFVKEIEMKMQELLAQSEAKDWGGFLQPLKYRFSPEQLKEGRSVRGTVGPEGAEFIANRFDTEKVRQMLRAFQERLPNLRGMMVYLNYFKGAPVSIDYSAIFGKKGDNDSFSEFDDLLIENDAFHPENLYLNPMLEDRFTREEAEEFAETVDTEPPDEKQKRWLKEGRNPDQLVLDFHADPYDYYARTQKRQDFISSLKSLELHANWLVIAATPEEECEIEGKLKELKPKLNAEFHGKQKNYRDGGINKPGGIAFQALPITEMTAAEAGAGISGEFLSDRQLNMLWKDIRLEMIKGNLPCLKLRQFISSSRDNPDQFKKATSCILEILKTDEELGVVSDKGLKEVLSELG